MNKLTKVTLSAFAITIASIGLSEFYNTADGNAGGSNPGYAGDPSGGNKTCANSGCHTGTPTTEIGWITSNIPLAGYTPDSTYTITATMTRGNTKFGFQISAQNSTGTQKGTLVSTGTETKTLSSGKYITHTSTGTSGSNGTKTWTFDWTAPAAGGGDVTFYGAFNASNGNTFQNGDTIFKSQTTVSENLTGIEEWNLANTMSVYPNPVSDKFAVHCNEIGVAIEQINIIDLNGKVVTAINNITAGKTIDISTLSAGTYLVEIETLKGNVFKKIIKE